MYRQNTSSLTNQKTVWLQSFEVEFNGAWSLCLPERESNKWSSASERHRWRLLSCGCFCSSRHSIDVAMDLDIRWCRLVQRQVKEIDVRRQRVTRKYYLLAQKHRKAPYTLINIAWQHNNFHACIKWNDCRQQCGCEDEKNKSRNVYHTSKMTRKALIISK